MLTSARRDRLPRQQTIRGTLDWSYDLLDVAERSLFRQLGIFVDGFTLEGAARVSNDDGIDQLAVLDRLESLVAKSLVLVDKGAARYRLLESTREYPLEKLASADEREPIARRYVRYLRDRFAELRVKSEEQISSSRDFDETFAQEIANVRSALTQTLQVPDLIVGAELLSALADQWQAIGLGHEGGAWMARFLAALPATASRLRSPLSGCFSFVSDRVRLA